MRKLLLILLLLFPQLPGCYRDEMDGTIVKYEGVLITKEHRPFQPASCGGGSVSEKFTICIRLENTNEARVFETPRCGGFRSNKKKLKAIYYGFEKREKIVLYWKQ